MSVRKGIVGGERGRGEALSLGADAGENYPADDTEDEEDEEDEEEPAA